MDKLNLQNLPRGGALRRAIKASNGYSIIAVDLSQIEARMVAALSGQDDLLQVFREGGDPYCYFASEVFGRKITKVDTLERFMGKTAILGLGYGMGVEKFQASVKRLGDIDITLKEAKRIVYAYRDKFSKIPDAWIWRYVIF